VFSLSGRERTSDRGATGSQRQRSMAVALIFAGVPDSASDGRPMSQPTTVLSLLARTFRSACLFSPRF
jgi:hypothetical protein